MEGKLIREMHELSVPKEDFFDQYWNALSKYRGRMIITMYLSEEFSVTILTRVLGTQYFLDDCRLVMFLDVGKKAGLVLHLYLKKDQESFVSGLDLLSDGAFRDKIWNECPMSVRIVD